MLERQPTFLSAKNNLSLAYWAKGDTDSAIATAKSVLNTLPTNAHALSNLVRFLSQIGDDSSAQPYADRLKATDEPNAWNVWTKKVEGLSYLGDDTGVVEIYEQWQADESEGEKADPLFHHLVAVGLARCDRPKEARTQWKAALSLRPGMTIVEANLKDLVLPVGQRSGAWPFSLSEWFAPQTLSDFQKMLASLKRIHKIEKMGLSVQQFLAQNPAFIQQVPRILERGGPEGQSFAIMLGEQTKEPELMVAIKAFALSQDGTDQLRYQAAILAMRAGILDKNKVRLWIKGKWTDTMLLAYEIHGEPDHGNHSKKVADWQVQAVTLLHEGTKAAAYKAEELLQKALAVEPDAPDLLFNMTAVYTLRGHEAEANALVREIHQQFPDYLFARTAMSRLHIDEGNLEEARDLLKPLLEREKFHFSEFNNLMAIRVELEIADKNYEAAQSWIQNWERVSPDHPHLAHWKNQLRRSRSPEISAQQSLLDKLSPL